jgi:poly(hydroxyalkanoate) depolymerase family esterase
MTRCAQACFDWFRSPPEEGWSGWRTTIHAERAEPGGTGKRNREGVLECGAWLPEGAGPRPLVVVLHGCGQSPDEIDDEMGWLKQAEIRRFAVLFIRETEEGRDNPMWWGPMIDRHCFDWFDVDGARKNEGQPAAIMRVIDKLTTERGDVVDRNRVFVVGFSAGAGMAGLLLTAWPDRLAGAGMIAGPAVGVAESLSGGWAIYVSPHMMFWPETMRRWAADLRAEACRGRGVRPTGRRHKVSIWHGEVDTVVNRGHSVALVDQFAGMMDVPVTRQWSWFMPRLEISGQTAGHMRRTLIDPLGGGARRSLHRVTFTASGEAVIQANWIDYLGHAAPVAPAVGANGEIIGENERRKYVGIDSTSEMLDFFGVASPTAL